MSTKLSDIGEAAPSPEHGIFVFGGVRYHYLHWPSACRDNSTAPPVVLLHGFAQQAESWSEVASLLAHTRDVYALDLVGHGGSERPDNPATYGLDAQADALLAFLEASCDPAGAQHPAASGADPAKPVVVGYSMGGRIALAAACRNPQALGALVLESAGLGAALQQEYAQATQRDQHSAARLRADGVESFMDAWEQLPLFATQRTLPADVRARLRAGRLSNDAEALARTFEGSGQHTMPSRAHTLGRVAQLAIPVLYVVGSLDAKYCALAEAFAVIPAVVVEVVEGVGHSVHLEAPDVYASVVDAFAP